MFVCYFFCLPLPVQKRSETKLIFMTKKAIAWVLLAYIAYCPFAVAEELRSTEADVTAALTHSNATEEDTTATAAQSPAEIIKEIVDPQAAETAQPATEIYQQGNATYYGRRWHGRRTSSGERLNVDDFQCAHRTLPFGTLVKVTNKRNNKSCIVRVIDRGPFGKGRIIDLTDAAAKKIDMYRAGVVPVSIEIIKPGTPVANGEIQQPAKNNSDLAQAN